MGALYFSGSVLAGGMSVLSGFLVQPFRNGMAPRFSEADPRVLELSSGHVSACHGTAQGTSF